MHIHTLHTNCFDQFIDFRQIQSSKHRCHPSRSFSDRHFRARRSSPLVPWDWSVIHGFNMCNGLKWNVYLRPPNIRYIYNIYCSILLDHYTNGFPPKSPKVQANSETIPNCCENPNAVS